jgi:hypothetical protein
MIGLRTSRRRWTRLAAIALLLWPLEAITAQDPPAPDESERAARLKEAEMHVADLKMVLARTGEGVLPAEVQPIDKPLLTYGDTARSNADGTLWAWGRMGRPLVLMETYRNTYAQQNRVNAISLTSTERVTLTVSVGQVWAPKRTQIEFQPLSSATEPEEREAARLRQLRELSRRFAAHEFWDPDNSRFELRLLAQPVHRYSDAQAGLADGAVFVLANGTNPEVLLLIEALAKSNAGSRWQYGLARLGSAELHVSLDGREVWKQERTPGVVGLPEDPYWLFITPRPAAP